MILIIAYGNNLRRDDGAGLALGAALSRLWSAQGKPTRLLQTHQLLPEHAEEISRADVEAVVFCDASRPAGKENKTLSIRPVQPAAREVAPGHFLSPESLLVYAAVFRVPSPAWLITIPGTDFNHGEGFSADTAELLQHPGPAAQALLEQITKLP